MTPQHKSIKLIPTVAAAMSLLAIAAVAAPGVPSGKALLESRCTACHDVKVVLAMKKDRRGWKATVAEMRETGAKLTDAEAATLINYLVRSAGR